MEKNSRAIKRKKLMVDDGTEKKCLEQKKIT